MAGTEPTQPPRQAELATPPQEGNCPYSGGKLRARGGWVCIDTAQSPQCICARHLPSTGGELFASEGGELAGTEPTPPPRQASLATPPTGGELFASDRRGISWYRTHTTTPSSFACHPSTGGELFASEGGELAGTKPTQPPRQAAPATPPQEGNCLPPQEGN